MQYESSVRTGSGIGNNRGHPQVATTRDQKRVRVALSTGAGHVSVKDTGIGMRVSAVRASISREQGQISGGPKDVPSNSTSNQILDPVLCGVSRLDICPTWKQGNEADQN